MIKIQTYIVKKGDTLYGISNQYGVSVTELAELNNIKGSNLDIGDVLKIPNNLSDNPNNMFMYTVKQGDTLYGIARKYNTTVEEIKKLNYLKDNNLTPGMIIRIPEFYTKEEDMYLPQYINYVVKKGDTLYSIAKDFNLAIDTIKKDNALVNNNLSLGQNLKIRVPSSEVEECFGEDYQETSSIKYKVQKGDTLYSIAKKFNTTVDSIIKNNNLKTNALSIGQELNI